MNIKKIITCLTVFLLLVSSVVFATDVDLVTTTEVEEPTILISTRTDDAPIVTANTIDEDLYVHNTNSYSLNDIVNGNVFASTTKFVVNPRNNGGVINGDLFVIAGEDISIQSDVVYSNQKDSNGNYKVESINSKSLIYGNVYALTDSFTLETGAEIFGNLYVAANNVTLEQNSVVHGNMYVVCQKLNVSGQIQNSAYIGANNAEMSYFGYIGQDLFLNAENATLDGVTNRSAFISVGSSLTTQADFKVKENLTVNYADNFTMSGKVNGNAKFNVKNLNLRNDENNLCIIRGNLNYATKNDVKIPDGVVSGEVTKGNFKEINSNNTITNTVGTYMFSFAMLLVFVFAIVFISKKFAPNAVAKLPEINVSNTFKAFGIGLLSMFAVVIAFVLLAITGVGITLAFFMLIVYMVILGLAIPLILDKISELLKWNLNSYVKLLIVTAVYYLISLVPVVGGLVTFIIFTSGIGNILRAFFKKKD